MEWLEQDIDALTARMERLEELAMEHHKLLNWLAGENTWQGVWDKANRIAAEIESEYPTNQSSKDQPSTESSKGEK